MRTWRQKRSHTRRQQILDAALACFSEAGVPQTAVDEIARRAGASVGSLYHQFGNKNGLAAAVYLEGLTRYQEGLVPALTEQTDARAGIQAIVHFHLDWVESHAPWARFLMDARRADFLATLEDDIRQLNQSFGQAVAGWMTPHMQAGHLRPLPVDLLMSLLLGPCHEYIRGRLGQRPSTPPEEAGPLLADAAWRALGQPKEAP